MLSSKIDVAYVRHDCDRLCQGDILRDFSIVEWATKKEGAVEIHNRHLPYSVVITQDCDLEQDFYNRKDPSKNTDKYLQSILLCPAYPAATFREGKHLNDLGQKMQNINSDMWRQLKENKLERYHYLTGWADLQAPESVVDFKHYFTVPRDIVYTNGLNQCYLATIAELFREHFSQRFAQYLSRIGMPEIKMT